MKKILVVDDNEQNIYILKILLEGNGYKLAMAKNGSEALETAKSNVPDLIISDILMPVMDGFALCRTWKTDAHLKNIPFIFYTATYTDAQDEEFALSLGAERFVRKPIDLDKFLEIVKDVLIEHKTGKTSEPQKQFKEEEGFLKIYNEALIRKMEDKMFELEQVNKRLSALFQTSIDMASLNSIEEVISHVLEKVVTAMDGCRANYFEYNGIEKDFHIHSVFGKPYQELAILQRVLKFHLGEERGLVGLVGDTRKPLIVNDTSSDPRWIKADSSTKSALFLPMICEERLIGVLSVLSSDIGKFQENSLQEMATLANNLAVAIEKARLFEKIQLSEESLRESEKFLNSVIENIPDMIFVKDAQELRFVRFNKAGEVLLGLSKQEMYGKNDYDFFPAVEAEYFIQKDKETLKKRQLIDIPEETIMTKAKGERILHTQKIPILDETGSPKYLLGISEDITEYKQALEVLRESKERFSNAFEFAPIGMSLVGIEGNYLQVNHALCEITGYSEKELLKKYFQEITHPDDLEIDLENVRQMLAGDKKTYQMEKRYLHKLGQIIWVLLSVSLVHDKASKPLYFLSQIQDITKRKQTEKEMQRLITDLRNLSEVEKKNRLFAEALAKNIISIRSTLNTNQILDSIIGNIQNVVPSDAISIMLIEGDHARIVRSRGYQERGLTDWIKERQFSLKEIRDLREIIRSKKYKITANADTSKDWTVIAETAWIKSNINTPIVEDNAVIGFVNVDSTTPDFYTEEHAQHLTVFTDQVSTALKNARLYEATQQRLDRMQAINRIDQAINSSLDLNVSLEIVLIQTKEQLHADAVDILLVNNVTHSLVFSRAKGFKTDEIRKTNLSLGSGLPGKAVLDRTMVAIPDLKIAGESYFKNMLIEREGFVSYYCMPLIAKGQLKGVMEVYYCNPFQADREWKEFLETLAQQTAIAINNFELLNSLQVSNAQLLNAYETTLKGWVDALDIRDKETEGHTQRVAELALKLARRMGIKDTEIINFQRGSLLHDIGKVAVSDTILNKPGPLTEEEWGIMRQHPLIAYQLLSKSNYLIPALDIPYCHHEKWDGSGYPRGLKGEDIPLSARIFAIMDVWDALISDRPYRKAWTKMKALEYIREQSGKHFDPQVVKMFLTTIQKDNK